MYMYIYLHLNYMYMYILQDCIQYAPFHMTQYLVLLYNVSTISLDVFYSIPLFVSYKIIFLHLCSYCRLDKVVGVRYITMAVSMAFLTGIIIATVEHLVPWTTDSVPVSDCMSVCLP